MARDPSIVVAGHVCLDIIPRFAPRGTPTPLRDLLVPGSLVEVGAATIATGGAVANVGGALHRLGTAVRLVGKIGIDPFGDAVVQALEYIGHGLAAGMTRSREVATSYTFVVNPPGVDRVFLHCPGANDTFTSDDLPIGALAGARLLHFGYPPLMRSLYSDGGLRVRAIMDKAKAVGAATALDMSQPDPESDAGKVDWRRWLGRVLPAVDCFLPSYEELLLMLDRERFMDWRASPDRGECDPGIAAAMAGQLLGWGAAVVAIKLGAAGLYLRTTSDAARLRRVGVVLESNVERWRGRELYVPCFLVDVVGTTGSGDCTIAGLLAALDRGLPPEAALRAAVGVGACSVEAADATSGVRRWDEVTARIDGGWSSRPAAGAFAGWPRTGEGEVRRGPADRC